MSDHTTSGSETVIEQPRERDLFHRQFVAAIKAERQANREARRCGEEDVAYGEGIDHAYGFVLALLDATPEEEADV